MPVTQNTGRLMKGFRPYWTSITPAKAGEKFHNGAYAVADATGLAVEGAAITAGMTPLGVLLKPKFPENPDHTAYHLDNRNGPDGVIVGDAGQRVVYYATKGEYAFPFTGTVPRVGQLASLVDNGLMTVDLRDAPIGGRVTRPAPGGQWFVEIGERRAAASSQVVTTTFSDVASASQIAVPLRGRHLLTEISWINLDDSASPGVATLTLANDAGPITHDPISVDLEDGAIGQSHRAAVTADNLFGAAQADDYLVITSTGVGGAAAPVRVAITLKFLGGVS